MFFKIEVEVMKSNCANLLTNLILRVTRRILIDVTKVKLHGLRHVRI